MNKRNQPSLGRGRYLFACIAGLASSFAFAPYELWPLMPLSLGLLLLLLQGAKRPGLVGFSFGCGWFGHGISWVHVSMDKFGDMPLAASLSLIVLLVFYLSLYPAFACWLTNRWRGERSYLFYLLWIPTCWFISEWARGHIMTGFPWLMPGYSQINSPLSGFAPLLGVMGITWLTLALAGSLTLISRGRIWLPVAFTFCLISSGTWLTSVHWTQLQSPMTLALVQGNIPLESKWQPENRIPIIQRYQELSQNLKADVIVWPESALPLFEFEAINFFYQYDAMLREEQKTLITGVLAANLADDEYYNALIALGVTESDDEKPNHYEFEHANRYYKRHLVPIGEFVPFEKLLRPLAPIFNLPNSSFTKGSSDQHPLQVLGHHWVPAICYEILFGEELRDLMHPEVDAIITVSNDTWFGGSIGPPQHLEIARMRALEFNRPIVRSTNTGITALINSRGQVTAMLPSDVEGVLEGAITPATGATPYQNWGQLPVILLGLCGLLAFGHNLRHRKKSYQPLLYIQ